MQQLNAARLFKLAGLLLLTGACAAPSEVQGDRLDEVDTSESGQIIGASDFVVVGPEGENLPARYRPIINAFGRLSMGCSATHIGGGIALTAGHCFGLGARVSDQPCSDTVSWGLRRAVTPYLTSKCTSLLAGEDSGGRDWAIFRVSPVPEAAVEADLGPRREPGTKLTIFGHPQGRPLEWSQTCSLLGPSQGPSFLHQCDTEPGNSGSTILDDETLRVVGIHDGATGSRNFATHLAETTLAEILGKTTRSTPQPTAQPAPVACAAGEQEPNNRDAEADRLAVGSCGALTRADADWFTWTVGTAPTPYSLRLTAEGDAQVQLWKIVAGERRSVVNTTATSFDGKVSRTAGTYFAVVTSPSGEPQRYSLSLSR